MEHKFVVHSWQMFAIHLESMSGHWAVIVDGCQGGNKSTGRKINGKAFFVQKCHKIELNNNKSELCMLCLPKHS